MGKLNLENQTDEEIRCPVEVMNTNLFFEFPIINYEKFCSKPYTYFYGTNVVNHPFSVIKQNVVNRSEMLEFKYEGDGKNYFPSEPVFVERPGATSEDDGVLLVMVLSEDNDFLSILDAKDLKELARAELPPEARGSLTFHGFFADKQHFPSFTN